MMLGLALSICNPGLSGSSQLPLNVVCVGDSLTHGTGSTDPGGTTSYPYHLATELGLTYGTDVHNIGVPGASTHFLPDPDYLIRDDSTNWLVIMIGVNDIYGISNTAANTFARLQAYVAARPAGWHRITVCTLTGNTIGTSGQDDEAEDLDALIVSTFDSVADVAADPDVGFSAVGGAPNFDGDGLHLESAGYAIVAGIIATEVPALSSSAATIEPEYGVVRDANLTAWFRDWLTLDNSNLTDVAPIYNIAEGSVLTNYVNGSGTFADLEASDAVFNDRPSVVYPGDAFLQGVGLTWAELLSASAFTIELVATVHIASVSNSISYATDAFIGDNASTVPGMPGLGIFTNDEGGGVTSVRAYCNDNNPVNFGIRETAPVNVTVDTPLRIRVRLYQGLLGISVNGAAFVTTPCNNVDVVFTATPRLGMNFSGTGVLNGKIADVRVYDNVDTARDAINDAYDTARYGL